VTKKWANSAEHIQTVLDYVTAWGWEPYSAFLMRLSNRSKVIKCDRERIATEHDDDDR
jgi:hypothetical protein